MAKEKFTLTKDLVKIEAEPIQQNTEPTPYKPNTEQRTRDEKQKESISLKISKSLKEDFQVFCIKNNIKMTEGLELALSRFILSPFQK